MESTVNAVTANHGVVADALAARSRQTSPIAAACGSWGGSHASTPGMTTGGVRLLPATKSTVGRASAAYGNTSIPFSGPSTLSPPV